MKQLCAPVRKQRAGQAGGEGAWVAVERRETEDRPAFREPEVPAAPGGFSPELTSPPAQGHCRTRRAASIPQPDRAGDSRCCSHHVSQGTGDAPSSLMQGTSTLHVPCPPLGGDQHRAQDSGLNGERGHPESKTGNCPRPPSRLEAAVSAGEREAGCVGAAPATCQPVGSGTRFFQIRELRTCVLSQTLDKASLPEWPRAWGRRTSAQSQGVGGHSCRAQLQDTGSKRVVVRT